MKFYLQAYFDWNENKWEKWAKPEESQKYFLRDCHVTIADLLHNGGNNDNISQGKKHTIKDHVRYKEIIISE